MEAVEQEEEVEDKESCGDVPLSLWSLELEKVGDGGQATTMMLPVVTVPLPLLWILMLAMGC